MRLLKTFIVFLGVGCFMAPAIAGEIIIPDYIKEKITAETSKAKKIVPVNLQKAEQSKQIFRTWASGSIDFDQATSRVSERFDRTSYIQSVTEEKLRLPTERLKTIPMEQRSLKSSNLQETTLQVQAVPQLQLQKPPVVQLKAPLQVVYREGPAYFKFQKIKEVRSATPLKESIIVDLTKKFLLENSFFEETPKDTIGKIQVLERRINEDLGEGKTPDDYLVQQDVVFQRLYEGKPVINSKITLGILPSTKDIVLFKQLNWSPVDEKKEQQISQVQLKSIGSGSAPELVQRLQQKIKENNGNFSKAEVKQVISGWFQTDDSLIPVLAFEVYNVNPDKFSWRSFELINLAGSDDVFHKAKKTAPRPKTP